MEQLASAPSSLTQSQFAFAQRTGAHPGLTSHRGAVFFYREDEDGTRRWLVDDEGQVLDFVEFPKGEA